MLNLPVVPCACWPCVPASVNSAPPLPRPPTAPLPPGRTHVRRARRGEYAERIITHPSPVLRDHARARLQRQRERLTATYQAADKALEAVIRVMERNQ